PKTPIPTAAPTADMPKINAPAIYNNAISILFLQFK
ncbi:MAG: hypothetical protein ACI9MK_001558, partial [Oceanospirillaceae bacterium]